MLKIKKGDTVEVIAGKDKGTQSKVIAVLPQRDRVLVENVAIVTKHIKPTQGGKKGERIKKESPIHISNVMLVDPGSKKPTRVGFQIDEKGVKNRIAKASGKVL